MAEYNIVDISCKFNKVVKHLILIMDSSIRNNIMFDTVKRKIKISIDANPLMLLQEFGIYIFKYRDLIKNDNFDDLFLNTENLIKDDDINDIKEYSEQITKESSDGIKTLLKLLRELWTSYGNQEKKIIKKNIKTLLSEYCKYLSIRST